MNIKKITPSNILFTALLLATGCGASLEGNWEGEWEIEGQSFDLEMELEHDDDDTYVGEGEMDSICSFYYEGEYYYDDCTISFDVEVETEGIFGEQEVEVEVSDCLIHWEGDTYDTDCPADDELDWDGQDSLEGDLDGLEIDLKRK